MKDKNSLLKVNKNNQFINAKRDEAGNKMIGIAFVSTRNKEQFIEKINQLSSLKKYENAFWEEIFIENETRYFEPYIVNEKDFIEINTYEDLRNIDDESSSLNSEAIDIIKKVFDVQCNDIINIQVLKKGMTNRSFLFECNKQKYIMRIPGEGTDKLVNRKEEFEVYTKIKDNGICDDIYYINSENGYKITEFIDNARTCNAFNQDDLVKCMKKLKDFHQLNLKVNHEFDIFKNIDFYESLWNGKNSIYIDYQETKKNVLHLKSFIEKNIENKCLTHIDAVPDNFLIADSVIKLIDWEYAGMQDPHVDIAMFSIYSLYERKQIDDLIDLYFENKCKRKIRVKIYAYISVCGLLWSNWCEYKRNLGIEFGEYAEKQYKYAKEYYKIVKRELESWRENE